MVRFFVCRRVDGVTGMPLRETEAIVLRAYRLGEADKIVSLLTRQFGRLRAVAAGAQRPRNRYRGVVEPLSYVRLWLFERENRDLLRMNSAELLESFFDMQKDYRVQVAAQYLAEATERFIPERDVNERVFRLLLLVLRALKYSGEITRPLLYFDYWLLLLGGFLPDLEACAVCGRALGLEAGYYSSGAEGLSCANCRTAEARQDVSPHVRTIANQIRESRLERWLASEKPAPGCRELRLFLEELVESHLGKKLVTRSLLAQEV